MTIGRHENLFLGLQEICATQGGPLRGGHINVNFTKIEEDKLLAIWGEENILFVLEKADKKIGLEHCFTFGNG